jgi:hypothetical protein
LRSEVRPLGVEIVTVCLETLGADEARPYVEAAAPEHPSLIDVAHRMDELFGVVNIPSALWIDEQGRIVRPAEPAWPAPRDLEARRSALGGDLSGRLAEIMDEASRIVAWTADGYADAVRDWARNGASSRFVLPPEEVIARSTGRDRDGSAAAAHFALAQHLERAGDHQRAVMHFREAHRLAPDNWTYKRQAWSLESGPDNGPMRRFWQGPVEGEDWPYDSDWLTDIRNSGARDYYRETQL